MIGPFGSMESAPRSRKMGRGDGIGRRTTWIWEPLEPRWFKQLQFPIQKTAAMDPVVQDRAIRAHQVIRRARMPRARHRRLNALIWYTSRNTHLTTNIIFNGRTSFATTVILL